MPCPHFSSLTGECVLPQEREEDDEPREPPVEEPTDLNLCLSQSKRYRECPAFKRFIADLVP